MSKLISFVVVVVLCVGCIFLATKLRAAGKENSQLTKKPLKLNAWLDSNSTISVKLSEAIKISSSLSSDFIITDNSKGNIAVAEVTSLDRNKNSTELLKITSKIPLAVNQLYMLDYKGVAVGQIMPRKVLDGSEFYYEGNDLGCSYAADKTVFKLWAPTVVNISALIYDNFANNLNFNSSEVKMKRADNGVWTAVLIKI